MGKTTVHDFLAKKTSGQKITMITAYDYPFALIADKTGIDAILVGDSLAMVVQGLDSTLPVTMDEMVYHTRIVSRAVKHALVIADMPFLSYQASVEEAVRSAGRFLKEGGASAVKVEGGGEIRAQIAAMTRAEIPVIAHIGLTPQAIHRMGGYKIQGRSAESAQRLLEDAHILQDAGAFGLVLEAVPMSLAEKITANLSIPTIGIGAGPSCNGQVLVIHDVLGLFDRFVPKFVKRYADLGGQALTALSKYKEEVENGVFPSNDQGFE